MGALVHNENLWNTTNTYIFNLTSFFLENIQCFCQMMIFDSSRFFNIVVENTKISLEYILQTTRDILQRISIDVVVDTTHWAKIPQKVKSIKSAKFNNIWNFFKQSGPKRNLLSETFKFCYGSNSSICILFLRGCILLRMRNRWSGSQTLFFFFTIFSKYGTMKNHQIHIPFEFDWKFMGEGESLSLLVGFSIVYQISKLVGDSDRPKRGQTSVNLEWSGLIIVPYIDNRHLMPAHNFKKVK